MRADLAQVDSTRFERGLRQLGELLGFDAERPGGDNAPDSVWFASARLAFVWEAKSRERADGTVGARTAQQAAGHPAWVSEHRTLDGGARIVPLLASDRRGLTESAAIHAGDVRIVRLDTVRAIAEQAAAALARVRARGQTSDDSELRSAIVDELARAQLLPSMLEQRFGAVRLKALPISR